MVKRKEDLVFENMPSKYDLYEYYNTGHVYLVVAIGVYLENTMVTLHPLSFIGDDLVVDEVSFTTECPKEYKQRFVFSRITVSPHMVARLGIDMLPSRELTDELNRRGEDSSFYISKENVVDQFYEIGVVVPNGDGEEPNYIKRKQSDSTKYMKVLYEQMGIQAISGKEFPPYVRRLIVLDVLNPENETDI